MSTSTPARFISRQQHIEFSRHLLRALLRESTYLPDPASQPFIRRNILHRYRAANRRGNELLDQAYTDQDELVANDARKALQISLSKGTKALNQLIRANEGEIRPLLRVLRHTYARTGPRRYEILHDLLKPDEDVPPRDEVPETKDITTVPVPPIFELIPQATGINLVYKVSPRYSKIAAIATSQKQNSPASTRQRLQKQISVPAKNAWARSTPRKRVKNLMQKHYARFLDALIMPLPELEWRRLEGLATGTVQWDGCKPRRKRPAGRPSFLTPTDLEKIVHIPDDLGLDMYLGFDHSSALSKTERISAASRGDTIKGYWNASDEWMGDDHALNEAFNDILKHEVQLRPLNKSQAGKDRGHTITPRFMRRVWMSIWQSCPLLVPGQKTEQEQEQLAEKEMKVENKWKVVWGSSVKESAGDAPREAAGFLFAPQLPRETEVIWRSVRLAE